MEGYRFLFIAANIITLVILAAYLYKQFEHKLELEHEEFEKMKRSVKNEDTE